jgi:hypothetical protein
MRNRQILGGLVVSVVVALAFGSDRTRAFQRQPELSVPELLAAAGRYVAKYESSFGAVVAEERNLQSIGGTRRATTGDILLFNSSNESGGAGWMAFRDVQTLDTQPFPSQPGRLAALAANPTRETLIEAMRVTAVRDSLTIGSLPRTAAIPTTALTYLRAAKQPFSTFEFDGLKTIGDGQAAVVKFTERPRARMTDADDFTTSGRFWIDPASGRVLQTELSVTSTIYNGKVEVQYSSIAGMDLWMPVRMFEQHSASTPLTSPSGRFSGGATSAYADGLATYQSFQRFDLKPGLTIK